MGSIKNKIVNKIAKGTSLPATDSNKTINTKTKPVRRSPRQIMVRHKKNRSNPTFKVFIIPRGQSKELNYTHIFSGIEIIYGEGLSDAHLSVPLRSIEMVSDGVFAERPTVRILMGYGNELADFGKFVIDKPTFRFNKDKEELGARSLGKLADSDLKVVRKNWGKNISYPDILRQLAQKYGFKAGRISESFQDGTPYPAGSWTTEGGDIMQNDTDYGFMAKMAADAGCHVWSDGQYLHWEPYTDINEIEINRIPLVLKYSTTPEESMITNVSIQQPNHKNLAGITAGSINPSSGKVEKAEEPQDPRGLLWKYNDIIEKYEIGDKDQIIKQKKWENLSHEQIIKIRKALAEAKARQTTPIDVKTGPDESNATSGDGSTNSDPSHYADGIIAKIKGLNRKRSYQGLKLNITTYGIPEVRPNMLVQVDGLAKYSGKWVVLSCTHRMYSISGYDLNIVLRRASLRDSKIIAPKNKGDSSSSGIGKKKRGEVVWVYNEIIEKFYPGRKLKDLTFEEAIRVRRAAAQQSAQRGKTFTQAAK